MQPGSLARAFDAGALPHLPGRGVTGKQRNRKSWVEREREGVCVCARVCVCVNMLMCVHTKEREREIMRTQRQTDPEPDCERARERDRERERGRAREAQERFKHARQVQLTYAIVSRCSGSRRVMGLQSPPFFSVPEQ